MSSTMRTLVRQTSENVSGAAIATVGLSLAVYAFEANRMASFQNVPAADITRPVSLLATVIVLGVLALLYNAKPSLRIHRHPAVGFLIAGLLSASLLATSGSMVNPDSPIYPIGLVVSSSAKSLLLMCWMEVLYALTARQFAVIMALAVGVTGVLNGLSALVKQDVVMVLVAMVPLLSAACLYWLKDKRDSFDVAILSKPGADAGRRNILCAPGPYHRGLRLIYLAPVAGFTFAFGFTHYAWVPFQDGSSASLIIQMSAAAGTLLASVMLLFLVAYFWGPKKIQLYGLFVLLLLGITLYTTTMLQGALPGLYVVPLNIAQKTFLFLVFLCPFLVPARRSSLAMAACASGLYTLGRAASTLAAGFLSPSLYSIIVLAVILAIALLIIAGIVVNSGHSGNEGDAAGPLAPAAPTEETSSSTRSTGIETRTASSLPCSNAFSDGIARVGDANSNIAAFTGPSPTGASPAANEDERLQDSCNSLARTYGLTNREREILWLLAHGMTAGAIAEELTVSTSTVKTHMRNVYAKLEIHTQNELLIMVHRG